MNADGSQQTRLTHNESDDSGPVWSPDGTMIAFVSDRDGDYEVYVMNADGSQQTSLTDNSVDENWPAWSPDGTKIAFMRRTELWIMDSDGLDQTRVWGNVEPQEGGPVFSPSGNTIAFTGRGVRIYTVNAEGFEETKLPVPGGWTPAWSPDGAWIAYWNARTSEVHVVSAEGSSRRTLTHTPGREDRRPAWSPDGTKIAFASRQSGEYLGAWNLYVMDVDGSDPTQIASGAHPDRGASNGGGLLVWSPDSTKIAFTCGGEICVANADGSGVARLTDSPGRDGAPVWSPAGTKIAFTSTRDA